jgi:hypothetical protein
MGYTIYYGTSEWNTVVRQHVQAIRAFEVPVMTFSLGEKPFTWTGYKVIPRFEFM